MDAASQLLCQKMPSKLLRTGKLRQQRDKKKRVATVGANHPAVAALCRHVPNNLEITSQVSCRTSPRRPSTVNGFMSQQATALLTQKAGNDDVSILTHRVILQQSSVLDVDIPSVDRDVNKDTSIVSSDVLSVGTSTRKGIQITQKETTHAGDDDGRLS